VYGPKASSRASPTRGSHRRPCPATRGAAPGPRSGHVTKVGQVRAAPAPYTSISPDPRAKTASFSSAPNFCSFASTATRSARSSGPSSAWSSRRCHEGAPLVRQLARHRDACSAMRTCASAGARARTGVDVQVRQGGTRSVPDFSDLGCLVGRPQQGLSQAHRGGWGRADELGGQPPLRRGQPGAPPLCRRAAGRRRPGGAGPRPRLTALLHRHRRHRGGPGLPRGPTGRPRAR